MNKYKQRIAIAEFCGWTFRESRSFDSGAVGSIWIDGKCLNYYKPGILFKRSLPDYLNDLNAMHEAERHIPYIFGQKYFTHLREIYLRDAEEDQKNGGPSVDFIFGCWHATAAQRAEALLHTIGKWEND